MERPAYGAYQIHVSPIRLHQVMVMQARKIVEAAFGGLLDERSSSKKTASDQDSDSSRTSTSSVRRSLLGAEDRVIASMIIAKSSAGKAEPDAETSDVFCDKILGRMPEPSSTSDNKRMTTSEVDLMLNSPDEQMRWGL